MMVCCVCNKIDSMKMREIWDRCYRCTRRFRDYLFIVMERFIERVRNEDENAELKLHVNRMLPQTIYAEIETYSRPMTFACRAGS